jgi:hypothetical protein
MTAMAKQSWERWWVSASSNWSKLTAGLQADAVDELLWSAWLYELLSRDRRAYIFGKSFTDLAASEAWLWRDEMISTLRKGKMWSACCSETEANFVPTPARGYLRSI